MRRRKRAAAVTPEQLLERLQAQDAEAWADVVTTHLPGLSRAAALAGVPDSDVDDVVSAALLKAWRSIHGVEDAGRLRGWLYRITINEAMDHHRSNVRRFPPLRDCDAAAVAAAAGEWGVGAPGVVSRVLVDAINELTERERLVLVLYVVQGLTLAEVAEVVGCSTSTVHDVKTRVIGRLLDLAAEH